MALRPVDIEWGHEEATFAYATWALVVGQYFKRLSCVRYFLNIISISPDSLETKASHVCGRTGAYRAIPTIVVPRHAYRDVSEREHGGLYRYPRPQTSELG